VSLEMSNSITSYPQDRHKVYTTSDLTNVMYYYVYNYSGSGNNIQKLFITIPSINGIVSTNGMVVSSLRGNSYISNNGEIVVEYSPSIPPGENDVITVKFKDNLDDGETNIYWNSQVIFDSTADKRKPTTVVGGKVNYISFVMPLPYAKGGISSPNPKEIFVSDRNFEIAYTVTNTGVDKNSIRGIKIDIPSIFVLVSASNNGYSTNSLSGNSLYVFYTNALAVGQSDVIFITLSNTISYPTNVSIKGFVWNSKNTNYVEDASYGATVVKVVSLPSYYIYPNQVDTSYYYTNYSVYVKNDSSGSRSIKRVKVVLPNGYYSTISNLQSSTISLDAVYISNFGNTNIIVYYDLESKEIVVGDQDLITFYGYDNFDYEDTNYILKVYFDDGSGIWRECKVFVGYTNEVKFVMPPAMADVSIDPDYIYVSEVSNIIRIDVTNKGFGSNKVTRLRFAIPYGFTGFSLLSNTIGGIASNYISGGMMYVYYSNNSGILSGQMDSLYFDTASMFDVLTNVSFIVNVGNRNDNVWYVTGNIPNGTTLLRVIYPPLLILGYVNKGREIYTINTNAHIEYKLINKSRDIYVTNAVINFDTTNFNITSIFAYTLDPSSNLTNFATVITNTPNTIELRFGSTDFGFNKEAIVSIDVLYEISNYYTIAMTGTVWVYGATNTNTIIVKPSGLPQVIYVTNAPFGRVIGYVSPYRYPVTIKQVDSQGNVVKDSEGNDIVVISSVSNGYFYIPEAYPDGNDDVILQFENPNYRTMTKVFRAQKNKNNFVGTVVMLNKPFSKSAPNDQDIVSPNDNQSKVIVRSGNIQRDFSVDLYITNLSEIQKLAIRNDDKIGKPSTYDNMKGYYLDVRGYSYDEIVKEIGVNGDIIVYLYYPSVVSNYYENEDKLGIYYWKETTGEWIRIGGLVDKQNKFIIAKVSYLHRYYGIFETSTKLEGTVRNVVPSSKVFTPFVKGKSVDPDYGIVKISFEFDKPYTKYEVLIYNLEGRIVKRIIKEDNEGYVNGEIWWDGTDMDGKPVRNGVYLYRVKVEDKVYTGKVILVK
ncbi:MAG: FlgD immunoglobulin-like domain containing protein, partial [Brevinematia bacterium]